MHVDPLTDDVAGERVQTSNPPAALTYASNQTVNRILYVVSVTQARHDDAGKAFLGRKRPVGKTGKEARRAHERQLANPGDPTHVGRPPSPHRPPKEEIASAA